MRRLFPNRENGENSQVKFYQALASKATASRYWRIFSLADFRFYWIGAFISFSGSWIQRIAEGYFVNQLTRDEFKLGFVSFCSSIPVFFLGFVGGSVADKVDRRKLLVAAQLLFAAGATYLAIATWMGFVTYAQIVIVALLLGVVASFEMPARQAIVSRVVPPQDLATAIPITALTFNVARIVGPAIGTWVLSLFGVAMCYLLNGISFLALVWVVMAIKANLSPNVNREREPITDVIFEGARYTFRDVRLRALFILETLTGIFGIFYLSILPAITGESLGLEKIGPQAEKEGFGIAATFIGIGAILGLSIVMSLTRTRFRARLIKGSIFLMSFGLIALSFIHTPWLAYPMFALMGMASITQFNLTNTLFQILTPESRRGRVLAMHIWTLNGVSPVGGLIFGWVARISHSWPKSHWGSFGPFRVPTDVQGPSISLLIGGLIVLASGIGGALSRRGLANLTPDLNPAWSGAEDYVLEGKRS